MNRPVSQIAIKSINHEPWVELATGEDLKDWGKDEEIEYNQALRQTEKLRFYQFTFDFLSQNCMEGDYYEFGCHRVRTFRMALTEARRHNLHTMNFYAFDSFQGLPEIQNETVVPYWQQGALATSEDQFKALINAHGIYTENVQTIKGYYSNSLTPTLQNDLLSRKRKIALVNIDCDLYESAVPVFSFIEPLLQEGSVIYLDDYFAGHCGSPNRGVQKAFNEYKEVSAWKFIEQMQIGWWGRSYIVYQ